MVKYSDDYISIYKNLDLYDIKFDCFVDDISVKTGLSRPNKQEKIQIKKDLEKKDWKLEHAKGYRKYIGKSIKIYLVECFLIYFLMIIMQLIWSRTTFNMIDFLIYAFLLLLI